MRTPCSRAAQRTPVPSANTKSAALSTSRYDGSAAARFNVWALTKKTLTGSACMPVDRLFDQRNRLLPGRIVDSNAQNGETHESRSRGIRGLGGTIRVPCGPRHAVGGREIRRRSAICEACNEARQPRPATAPDDGKTTPSRAPAPPSLPLRRRPAGPSAARTRRATKPPTKNSTAQPECNQQRQRRNAQVQSHRQQRPGPPGNAAASNRGICVAAVRRWPCSHRVRWLTKARVARRQLAGDAGLGAKQRHGPHNAKSMPNCMSSTRLSPASRHVFGQPPGNGHAGAHQTARHPEGQQPQRPDQVR